MFFQLRPKISFVIRNLDHLAFVSADDDDGCHVSPLDLEADFAPAADDEEEREAAAEEDGSCKGDAVWNRVHRVDLILHAGLVDGLLDVVDTLLEIALCLLVIPFARLLGCLQDP